MKVVFLGSGAFGLPTLEWLSKAHDVCAVISQPDRPAGRKRVLTATPIAQWAQENLNVPVIKPENINEEAVTAQVRAFDADAWVIIAFGQKLGEPLLKHVFAINLHASLLPRWRGAAPINRAMLAGDATTGNSVISIASKMDAGAVYGRSTTEVRPDETAGELHDRLSLMGPADIGAVLEAHAGGMAPSVEQDETFVTHAKKLRKAEAWVDFSLPANECRWHVHGLNPWPGVEAQHKGKAIKLLRVQELALKEAAAFSKQTQVQPGTLLDAKQGIVACGSTTNGAPTALRLLEVQPVGKKPMTWNAYAAGSQPNDGERIDSSAKEQG